MSTMYRYDPDRIAALAAGSLDPAEAAAFEAEIAADPRAAAELAAQRLALAAIRRAPAPVLSADERTALRRSVAAALHLEESPRLVTAAASTARRVPWRPLAVAATALAALVAAVPLFGLLSVGGDESPDTTVVFAATTTLPADTALATVDAGSQEQSPTTDDSSAEVAILGAPDSGIDLPGARATGEATRAIEDIVADPAPLFAPTPRALFPCAEEAQALLGVTQPGAAVLALDGAEVVVWFVSNDGATVDRLVAFDPATCWLLAVHP
ncbi:MAG: hypothetical protein ABIJ48_06455 [Actinomycetota bacterium]